MLTRKILNFDLNVKNYKKMYEQTIWDPSLIKKIGSSNHSKLLNQLRNEVKKYPLKRIKSNSTKLSSDNNDLDSSNINIQNTKMENSIDKSSNQNESVRSESNVSFNNSKNFSIYNNNSDTTFTKKDNISPNNIDSNYSSSSTASFKDRLNKINLK